MTATDLEKLEEAMKRIQALEEAFREARAGHWRRAEELAALPP